MKSAILFFLMLGSIACKSNKKVSIDPKMDSSPLITLETSPCRGFCPVYKIAIKNDGHVDFEGLRFVKNMGHSTFQLTPSELDGLKKHLQEANLWQYPESFPVTIADAPGSVITLYRGDEIKEIRGSVELPKPIKEVAERLKSLAKIHGYNLDSFDPNAIPEEAQQMALLVKLKPDVNAGNWINALNQSSKANLRLVRRVSAENIWVVVFDASKHKTADILTLLKSNDAVLEAQENREAQERNKNEE
jgi:hypothetical protein